MEASSHGLNQNRLDGLQFSSGIFTNLSQDHLDYHKNLKNYLKAKLYLFEKLIKKRGNVITDEEIPQFQKLKKYQKKKFKIKYSLNEKKIILKFYLIHLKENLKHLKSSYKNSIKNINLKLIGKIQLKNLFMAIIAAQKSNSRI